MLSLVFKVLIRRGTINIIVSDLGLLIPKSSFGKPIIIKFSPSLFLILNCVTCPLVSYKVMSEKISFFFSTEDFAKIDKP